MKKTTKKKISKLAVKGTFLDVLQASASAANKKVKKGKKTKKKAK